MHVNKEKSLADAAFYKALKETESNKAKLTAQFLELSKYEAISKNTKIYFGDSIPKMFSANSFENSVAGADTNK